MESKKKQTENKSISNGYDLISAKSWRFFKGIPVPGIFGVMKFLYQWLIDHPQETYQAVKLVIEIWRRFRRRKRKSREITPGSSPKNTCLPLPIPGGVESPQTTTVSVSAVQKKESFIKQPKKKRSQTKKT